MKPAVAMSRILELERPYPRNVRLIRRATTSIPSPSWTDSIRSARRTRSHRGRRGTGGGSAGYGRRWPPGPGHGEASTTISGSSYRSARGELGEITDQARSRASVARQAEVDRERQAQIVGTALAASARTVATNFRPASGYDLDPAAPASPPSQMNRSPQASSVAPRSRPGRAAARGPDHVAEVLARRSRLA